MNSIQLKTRVGTDGVLKLEVPVEVTETDLDVLVVFQPLAQKPTPDLDKLGWPAGFFETPEDGRASPSRERPDHRSDRRTPWSHSGHAQHQRVRPRRGPAP